MPTRRGVLAAAAGLFLAPGLAGADSNRTRRRTGGRRRHSRSAYAPGGAARVQQSMSGSPELKVSSNAGLVMAGSTFCFAGWINFISTSNPNQHLINKLGGAAATDEWFLQVNSNTTLRWGFSNGSSYFVANWSAAITTGTWYFVYADWDGANLHINVNNGTPVTQAGTGPINSNTNPLRIGADGADGVDVNADLDAFALWKGRTLTAAEQTTLYNGGNGFRFSTVPEAFLPNLVSWWDFDGKGNALWIDSYGTNDLADVNDSVTVTTGKT